MSPAVSVYMPLHNAGPFAERAISSITRQSLLDIELVIVENGSTDGSREVARRAAATDPRIRLVEHDEPLGVAGAANVAVAACRAEVVARMDQDDVSHPERLALQLAVLERDPAAVAVGALAAGIDASGAVVRPANRRRLLTHSDLPPFPHGTLMHRRGAFERAGGYRAEAGAWEDADLLWRLADLGRVVVVPRVLYEFRFRGTGSTTMSFGEGTLPKLWTCREARRSHGSHEHLLAEEAATPDPRGIRWAATHRDGMLLWAGLPPGPRLPGAAPGSRWATARRTWHRRSPRTLRIALRLAMHARDLPARWRLRGRQAVAWDPAR